jgi:hypothetical protein
VPHGHRDGSLRPYSRISRPEDALIECPNYCFRGGFDECGVGGRPGADRLQPVGYETTRLGFDDFLK